MIVRYWIRHVAFTCVLLVLTSAARAEAPLLETASITELGAALASGSLTSAQLVEHALARIAAYDKAGPELRALIALNSHALETARALDQERKTKGARGPLHGIPVVVKDNIDTADLPTTAGSLLLEGSRPPDDAAVVRRLRAAGAIILAKANMSELALGHAFSSLGGAMHNPHDPTQSPGQSSGGSGAAVAAAYAPLALGTDTGGSIRSPAAANGIAALKPTYGLISRDGIIPLALSLDVVGPMARHVADLALALDVLAGSDPNDPATSKQPPKTVDAKLSYYQALDKQALKGARIGVVRDFVGQNIDVEWVVESALSALRARGATVVEVAFPEWLMGSELAELYGTLVEPEFPAQLEQYLRSLPASAPKTLKQLVAKAERVRAPRDDGAHPNPERWSALRDQAEQPTPLDDPAYLLARDHALPFLRGVVEALLQQQSLDALVYPTSDGAVDPELRSTTADERPPFVNGLANLSGAPELVVPAGFTAKGLPITLSFLGRPFSERRLLALGYSLEEATHALRLPQHTPVLQR